ncbi:MAG: class I SAM-dependent methyltransferase [Saprospiraceae bacterium]|nr:class I SAM-dependent methyltransferase [Saprospiraceae bacterium]
MSIKRYGKSSSALLNQKTSFFAENEKHLKNQRRIAEIYVKQPKRTNCKNCNKELGTVTDLVKDGVDYIVCDYCEHLNGIYEDTSDFCNAMYTNDSGEEYAANYQSADVDSYNYRTSSIYLPKANFLYTSLQSNKLKPNNLEYLDFGAGSGYFVAALKKAGLQNVNGTEVSEHQVNFGNAMIGENVLRTHNIEDTNKTIRESTAQVISMIGVLEHVQKPREVLEEIKKNDHIKYLYISVPTFSLSVYLEQLSPDVFHRQLHGGHTHLYTEKSLQHLSKEFGFEIMAEWWFGADAVDLFRHVAVTLEKTNASTKLQNKWKKDFIPIIDAVQIEIDKKHYSSEVHMLFKKI